MHRPKIETVPFTIRASADIPDHIKDLAYSRNLDMSNWWRTEIEPMIRQLHKKEFGENGEER